MRFNNTNPYFIQNKLLNIFDECLMNDDKSFPLRRRYDSRMDYHSIVFLCGGDIRKFASRKILTDVLHKNTDIKIVISENLETLRGSLDLMTFEIVLEAISKMVLICLESMGSACELGAFSNIGDSNKVVVILNNKYSNDSSFINKGPIQYLREKNDNRVIITSFHKDKDNKESFQLTDEIINICHHRLIDDKSNFTKYYEIDIEKRLTTIKDLTTFAAVILDYFCMFRFGNLETCKRFFLHIFNSEKLLLDAKYINENSKLDAIIQCLINIYESLSFLEKENEFYYVKSKDVCMGSRGDDWIGKILFTREVASSVAFLSFKSRVIKETRNIHAFK